MGCLEHHHCATPGHTRDAVDQIEGGDFLVATSGDFLMATGSASGYSSGLRSSLSANSKASSRVRACRTQSGCRFPESVKATPGRVYPPVVPGMESFLLRLKGLEPDMVATNYTGHGGGVWKNQGFSVDLTLQGDSGKRDERGFYMTEVAVRFLRNLDAAAGKTGSWRAIYNDFGAAERINKELGVRRVVAVKWHGPGPLRLHFHLDIVFPGPAKQDGDPRQELGNAPPVPAGKTPGAVSPLHK